MALTKEEILDAIASMTVLEVRKKKSSTQLRP